MQRTSIFLFFIVSGLNIFVGCVNVHSANESISNKSPIHLTAAPLNREQAINAYFGDRKLDSLEGIWVTSDGGYEIIIARDNGQAAEGYPYVGLITESNRPNWALGNVKFVLKPTASSSAFVCRYLNENRTEIGTTFFLIDNNFIEFALRSRYGNFEAVGNGSLIRNYPIGGNGVTTEPASQGTGFWINSNVVVTNSHVVQGAKEIKILVAADALFADVIVNDQSNDIALLKVRTSNINTHSIILDRKIPLKLGERVYAIGFPLSSILGTSPTVSEGIVSKLTGVGDDPREFQLSAPIQSGSSGSPVFDCEGQLVGIVSSTLSTSAVIKSGGSVPQNANFAIRTIYLSGLLNGQGIQIQAPSTYSRIDSPEDMAKQFQSSVVRIQTSR